jgi:hypothetical protein
MPTVTWSEPAEADLAALVPDHIVRGELKACAEAILSAVADAADRASVEDGMMWRQAITPEQESQLEQGLLPEAEDDGMQAWDYYFLFRLEGSENVQVTGLRHTRQIANQESVHLIFEFEAIPVGGSPA